MFRFRNNALFKGSLVLLISFNVFNVLNFVYHFIMARMLSVAEYGALVSILAIYTLIAIPSEAVQNTITRYVTLNPESGKVKNIMQRSFKKFSPLSFGAFVIFLIVSIPLASFLGVGYFALAVSGFVIFVAFLSPIPRAVLLGEKKYIALGANVMLEGVLKILFGVVLVLAVSYGSYLYLKVHGAILGVVLGSLIALFASFIPLRNIYSSKEEKADVKDIYVYVKPAIFISLTIFAFISIDVIIAKILFDAETAGSYAIASTLGKIIFFITGPVSKAMFPLTSSESNHSLISSKIFFYSGLLLGAIIFIGLAIYYLFPSLLLMLFSGKSLPSAEPILFLIAVASALIAVANLLLLYKLSIGKTRGFFYLAGFVIIEAILLWFYSGSLTQFSIAFLSAAIIFLIGTFVLLGHE